MAPLTEEQAESGPDDTTQIPAVGSGWSEDLLRQATSLLTAGESREVAELCHEVINREPQNTAAYKLLGMAEEENDNLHLALQAYEQVVALDPDRNLERDKVAALRERLADEPPPQQEDEESRRIKRLNRWATVALISSLLLLVMVVGTLFVIRARNAQLMQQGRDRAFAAAISRGEKLLEEERYKQAGLVFQKAYEIKASGQAQQLWQKAHQEYLVAQEREQRSMGGKISLESRKNPFVPVRIGPPEASESNSTSTGSGQRQFVPPPPVREGDLPPPLPEGEEGPLDDFLKPDSGQPSEEVAMYTGAGHPLTERDQTVAEQPAGQISIWVSEGNSAESDSGGPSADQLRSQADSLRRQGSYRQAQSKYEQAIDQYQQEIKANPATRSAKQVAINSVQRSMQICKQHSGD